MVDNIGERHPKSPMDVLRSIEDPSLVTLLDVTRALNDVAFSGREDIGGDTEEILLHVANGCARNPGDENWQALLESTSDLHQRMLAARGQQV